MKNFLVLVIMWGVSCTPHLSPPYSQTMVDKVKSGWSMNHDVYTYIKGQQDRTYPSYIFNYDNEEALIVSIKGIDSSRIKPGKLLYIDGVIYTRFMFYRKEHEQSNNITDAKLDIQDKSMETLWKDRIDAEENLKKP